MSPPPGLARVVILLALVLPTLHAWETTTTCSGSLSALDKYALPPHCPPSPPPTMYLPLTTSPALPLSLLLTRCLLSIRAGLSPPSRPRAREALPCARCGREDQKSLLSHPTGPSRSAKTPWRFSLETARRAERRVRASPTASSSPFPAILQSLHLPSSLRLCPMLPTPAPTGSRPSPRPSASHPLPHRLHHLPFSSPNPPVWPLSTCR